MALCESMTDSDPASLAQAALLAARSYLRLDKPKDALRRIDEALLSRGNDDEGLTARMLAGAAYVRDNEIGRGLEILDAAENVSSNAHPTIRSEIALNRALAFFGRRDFDEADRALMRVVPESDIVYARALEYRGWLASARGQYQRATQYFTAALDFHDCCRHYDRFLESNALQALAHLALELLQPDAWNIVRTRRARFDWNASGTTKPRFWISLCAASYAMEIDGAPLEAIREGRLAERIAPSKAARVEALCRRAVVLRQADNALAARDHAEAAFELFAELEPARLQGDDRLVSLIVAKQLASSGLVEKAKNLHAVYKAHSQTSPLLVLTGDPRQRAFECWVEGQIAEADDRKTSASHAYLRSFETYRRVGEVRRAVHTALQLGSLLGEPYLFDYAVENTRHLPDESWLRKQAERTPSDGLLRSLKPAQRDILRLLQTGATYAEIAQIRKRSPKTVRNTASDLYAVFGVRNRTELMNQVRSRGLIDTL